MGFSARVPYGAASQNEANPAPVRVRQQQPVTKLISATKEERVAKQ
jgi:hypothetical protein